MHDGVSEVFLYNRLYIDCMHSTKPAVTEMNSCTESTVIWYRDSTLDLDTQRTMQVKLFGRFKRVKTFSNKEDFLHYLNNKFQEPNIKFIISGKHAEELCRPVARKPERYNIYELDLKLTQSVRKSSNTWVTYSDVDALFKALDKDLKRNSIAMGESKNILDEEDHTNIYRTFLPPVGILDTLSIPPSLQIFDKDSLTCLLFQLLTKILVQGTYGKPELDTLCRFCLERYQKIPTQMKKIRSFQEKYQFDRVIRFYTEYSFLFLLLTEVFQCEDIDGIYQFRRYIADLHKKLAQIYQLPSEELILYRGKKLPLITLQQLKDLKQRSGTKDTFISINGFLSTTKDPKVAEFFAGIDGIRDGYETAMFTLKIKKGMKSTIVYCDIVDHSCKPDEKEILFSMGSLWKLLKIENSNGVWSIEVELSNEYEAHLNKFDEEFLTGHSFLREPTNAYLTFLLAQILYALGKYSQSGEFYHDILKNEHLSDEFKCLIYLNLATMRDEQGLLSEAKQYFEEALKFRPSTHPSQTLPSRAIILHKKGLVHQKKGEHQEAQKSFEAALIASSTDHDKATTHHSLGVEGILTGQINEVTHNHLQEAVRLGENHACAHTFRTDLKNFQQQQS